MLDIPEFMTSSEAAKALNVTTQTLWRWRQDGTLKPIKIGKRYRYRVTDIQEMLTPTTAEG